MNLSDVPETWKTRAQAVPIEEKSSNWNFLGIALATIGWLYLMGTGFLFLLSLLDIETAIPAFFFLPINLLISAVFLGAAFAMTRTFTICGNCGNRVERSSRQCPTCSVPLLPPSKKRKIPPPRRRSRR